MTVRQLIASFIEANATWLREQRDRRQIARSPIRIKGLYERVHADHEPVFVLSPGRSGSLFLTRALSIDSVLRPVHEPFPELGWHNTWALEHPGETSRAADFFDSARYEFIRDAHLVGRRYVETNNRCTFFARAVLRLYPRARFVHLVRNPVSFVRSGLPRGWYTGSTLYDSSRPVGSGDEWDQMDRTERIAWLWQVTHEFVDRFKMDHPERVHTVLAEDLFKDAAAALPIFRFLDRPVPDESKLRHATRKRANPNTKGNAPMTPADEQRIIARAPAARAYYPALFR